MQKYLPHLLFAAVFLVAAVGLTLNLTEDTTGDVVHTKACTSKLHPAWVNCVKDNGGCPDRFPPLKQLTVPIQHVDTCCCEPIYSQSK